MKTKLTKEQVAFAKSLASACGEEKTQYELQACLAADVSVKHGWTDDDLKYSTSNAAFTGAGAEWLCQCLAHNGVALTKQNVNALTIPASPVIRDKVASLLEETHKMKVANGGKGRLLNCQKQYLTSAKSGKLTISQCREKAVAELTRQASGSSKKADPVTTAAQLAKAMNEAVEAVVKKHLTAESAEVLVANLTKLAGKDLPKGLKFKAKK